MRIERKYFNSNIRPMRPFEPKKSFALKKSGRSCLVRQKEQLLASFRTFFCGLCINLQLPIALQAVID